MQKRAAKKPNRKYLTINTDFDIEDYNKWRMALIGECMSMSQFFRQSVTDFAHGHYDPTASPKKASVSRRPRTPQAAEAPVPETITAEQPVATVLPEPEAAPVVIPEEIASSPVVPELELPVNEVLSNPEQPTI